MKTTSLSFFTKGKGSSTVQSACFQTHTDCVPLWLFPHGPLCSRDSPLLTGRALALHWMGSVNGYLSSWQFGDKMNILAHRASMRGEHSSQDMPMLKGQLLPLCRASPVPAATPYGLNPLQQPKVGHGFNVLFSDNY